MCLQRLFRCRAILCWSEHPPLVPCGVRAVILSNAHLTLPAPPPFLLLLLLLLLLSPPLCQRETSSLRTLTAIPAAAKHKHSIWQRNSTPSCTHASKCSVLREREREKEGGREGGKERESERERETLLGVQVHNGVPASPLNSRSRCHEMKTHCWDFMQDEMRSSLHPLLHPPLHPQPMDRACCS